VGARRVLTVLLVLLLVAPSGAEDIPGKDARHQIAERHVSLGERLEKKHKLEAFWQYLLAVEMDPDCFEARKHLGYKKDDNKVWQGSPQAPPAVNDPIDKKLQDDIAHVRKDSATKLMYLAKHLVEDKKLEEAKVLAGLALEEDPNLAKAREIVGHEKRGEAWVSPRESRIRAAFAKALQGQKAGENKTFADQAAIEKLCGLGALDRRETDHAVLYWSRSAAPVEDGGLLRAAETAWSAHRYFIAGDEQGFSVDGDPKREATGGLKAPTIKPSWLVVAQSEHKTFVESAVADKKQWDFAKSLAGWQAWYQLPSGNVLLFEGCFVPQTRVEWVTAAMAEFLTLAPLEKRAPLLPDFLNEGLKRFFSGHVSGRAEIFYANMGSSTSKRTFQAGTFDVLRAHARVALQQAPEGELRLLLSKKTNEFDQLDSAVALAFFDYLLDRERSGLAKFMEDLKDGELPMTTLEKALKKSVDETERAFREWVREEY